jgi:serine/threonine protein kinase
VAIKIVDRTRIKPGSNIENDMRKECSILTKLDHPNILKVYDYGEDSGSFYCVMPLYEMDLFKYMDRYTIMPENKAFHVFEQLLDGVEYLHKNNIIHRDLKIENILVSDIGNVDIVIIDYGLSTTQKLEGPYLVELAGSKIYLSPEMFSENLHYRGRPVDVWAIGIIFYILLAGTYPYYNENIHKLKKQITEDPVEFDDEWNISHGCKNLINSILEKDPKKRLSIPEIRDHPCYANMRKKYTSSSNLVDSENKVSPNLSLSPKSPPSGFSKRTSSPQYSLGKRTSSPQYSLPKRTSSPQYDLPTERCIGVAKKR